MPANSSNEYQKAWKKRNPEKVKEHSKRASLKRLYGISLETYNEMFADQEGFCAICDKHASEEKYALCVDHDHNTGVIRGLLCLNCNTALGKFRDDADLLRAALKYLGEPNG